MRAGGSRRRGSSPSRRWSVVVPPFLGPIVYLFFRPPEYLEDVRERELEIRAIEERLAAAVARVPSLPRRGRSRYVVCPICTTRLKQACAGCGAPLEAIWQACPYCATPVRAAAPYRPTAASRCGTPRRAASD